jgi:3-oxoacyl-[acyl-carrier protein] reductase
VDAGLRGSVALVTGASRGIGAAAARALAAEGARVVVHYRSGREQAEALAAELPDAIALAADVAVEAEVDGLFARAVEHFGRIDVCVANAGIWPEEHVPVAEMSLARFQHTLAVDLVGVFLTCRAFLRQVAAQRSGSLVLVGSTAGLVGEEGHADYAAAKAAVTGGLLPSLKNEIVRVAPGGRVNAVCPGWTATEMAAEALAAPGAVERATRTMALRKVATPEDVAAQIVVLASDRLSGHVTGQAVAVAGGMEGRLLHPG